MRGLSCAFGISRVSGMLFSVSFCFSKKSVYRALEHRNPGGDVSVLYRDFSPPGGSVPLTFAFRLAPHYLGAKMVRQSDGAILSFSPFLGGKCDGFTWLLSVSFCF